MALDTPHQRLFREEDPGIAELKCEEVRKRLIGYFAHKGRGDPEDCAHETLKRALIHATDTPIESTYGFIWRTAEFVFLEAVKADRKQAKLVAGDEFNPGRMDDTERIILLAQVLDLLNPNDAALLQRSYSEDHARLAGEAGMSEAQFNSYLHNLRRQLREALRIPATKTSKI